MNETTNQNQIQFCLEKELLLLHELVETVKYYSNHEGTLIFEYAFYIYIVYFKNYKIAFKFIVMSFSLLQKGHVVQIKKMTELHPPPPPCSPTTPTTISPAITRVWSPGGFIQFFE